MMTKLRKLVDRFLDWLAPMPEITTEPYDPAKHGRLMVQKVKYK